MRETTRTTMRATTNRSVYLRSAPKGRVIDSAKSIPCGTLLIAENEEGKWLHVTAPDGTSGYVRKRSLCFEEKEHRELSQVLLAELQAVTDARPHPPSQEERLLLKKQQAEQKLERERLEDYLQPEQRKRTEFENILPLLHMAKLKALCLSGGGIRSATFNLGVLQGLARLGVLKETDYLSTVSGGGYIGSWLSSSIRWQKDAGAATAFEKVARGLAEEEPPAREPYQIRFLRDYSNYLTPRVGILSLDTWAVIGTYLRNLLLNWLVLLPLFFAVLLLPRILAHFASGDVIELLQQLTSNWMDGATLARLFVLVGGICAIIPIAHTVNNLPSVNNFKQSKLRFMLFFLLPLLCMALFLSAYWGYRYRPGCIGVAFGYFVGFGAAAHLLGFIVAVICPFIKTEYREEAKTGVRAKKGVRLLLAFFCSSATGAVAGALGWFVAAKLMPAALERVPYPELLFVTVSVPILLGIYLLTMTLVVALLSRWTGEHDREWWGRAAGVVMLAAVVWGAGMAVVVYGPWFLLPGASEFWQYLYAAAGGIFGIVAAKLGRDPSTPALRPGISMSSYRTTLLSVAAALFLVFLGQSLSLLTSWILWLVHSSSSAAPRCLPFPVAPGAAAPSGTPPQVPFNFDWHLVHLIDPAQFTTLWIMLAAAALLCLSMSWMVDINKFSMHAMYRNRLVRCYLGGARKKGERKQNPFTGFDRGDDIRMAELSTRPFHLVNMAWNMVKGNRLAWQQRKAASFTMSPLFAGSDIEPDPYRKSGAEPGGYRPIGDYAKGDKEKPQIKLGTAMAISGAAASPNMGYHSSTLVAFVMAFFNVRLGWWLGNTGTCMGDAWRKRKSMFSVVPLLKETFGLTNEGSKDIYLSDGGHFENLGLYEMVRRRCRYIIACDAGCDCDSNFEDLGNAVRKVRADFQIEIDIDLAAIRAKRLHFAVGEVKYHCCDRDKSQKGKLLYIKPVLTGDESVDVFNYEKKHAEFPHEPTSDQWFDEAQFESYRKLGAHSLEQLREKHELTLERVFENAERLHRHEVRKVHDEEKERARKDPFETAR